MIKSFQFLFLFVIIFFSNKTFAECINYDPGSTIFYNSHKNINNLEVEISKNKNWLVNSLNIAIGNFRFIPDEYKKNFKGKIKVFYKNGTICIYDARIRFSGDMKDHVELDLDKNKINQSVDVSLKQGNILGITNFKLLLKHTRGEDEILISELLKTFGYLAPKTYLTNVKINNQNVKMIFQEKNRKELLERNNRRESPILEGDERFVWLLSQQVSLDEKSNYEAGLVPLIKTGFKSMIAKQKNSNLILKNDNLEKMSLNVLTNLNKIYLNYSANFDKNSKHIESYRYYTLDNEMLGFYNKDKIIFLDTYNLIVMASSDGHSLSPNNRQFYWNSFEHFFEPVSYDGNFKISKNLNILVEPLSKYFFESFKNVENLFSKLNLIELNQTINDNGLNQSLDETKNKVMYLKLNIDQIKKKYMETINFEKNYLDANLNEYIQNLKKINKKVKFINLNENNEVNLCNNLKNCKKTNLSKTQLAEVIQADFEVNKEPYQFLGVNIFEKDLTKNLNFKKIKFQNSFIYYENNINLNINESKNIIDINQIKENSKIFFLNGNLENLTINFNGVNNEISDNTNSAKVNPIDINGLTGCLSFINVKVKGLKLNSNYSSCEDAINFINSSGEIDSIEIKNSISDGFDADFSNLSIKIIDINNSQNDCSDFSYGKYNIIFSNFSTCGDKSISVGEKSLLVSNEVIIKDSLIGVASKDSSNVVINKISLRDVETCLSAYNKKQEFLGGIINVEQISCKNFKKLELNDNKSLIKIQKKI